MKREWKEGMVYQIGDPANELCPDGNHQWETGVVVFAAEPNDKEDREISAPAYVCQKCGLIEIIEDKVS